MTPEKKTVSNPNTKINLIRSEFAPTMAEMKELTPTDRDQLASGIARNRGLNEEELGWKLVDY